jgi:hypothetical protein
VCLAPDTAADVDAFAVALDGVVGFTVVVDRVVAFAVSRCGRVSLTGCTQRVAATDIPVPHAVVFGERRDRVQCTAAVHDGVAVADPFLPVAKRGLAVLTTDVA